MVTNRASLLVALALLSAFAWPLLLTYGNSAIAVPRNNDPGFAKAQLWFFLVAVQGATWTVCAVLLVSTFATVWRRRIGEPVHNLLRALVPTGLLVAALVVYHRAAGAAGLPSEVGGIALNRSLRFATFGIVLAVVAVACMFFVRRTLLDATLDVSSYLFLKSQFDVFLGIAAIILSLGVVGSAALRGALNAKHGPTFFPAEYVVLYGAIFTLLLLIAYLPGRVSFWRAGSSLVGELMGAPPSTQAPLVKWLEDKGKLEKALDLELTSASALIGPAAAVLPLLSGWVSTLLAGTKP